VSNAAKEVLTILSLPGQVHCRVGLRGTARKATTNVVEAAACLFCECWGRDADEDKLQDGVKRNTNTKHWTNVFRSDNVRKHMVEQHSKRWKEYQALRNNRDSTEEDLKLSFQQSTVDAFLEKRSTVTGCKRVFTIETSIVDGIVKELLNPPNSDDEADPSEMPRGDPGMKVFEPAYVIESDGSKSISCYRVTINNALQFDCVVSLLAAGLSFRQISRVVRENRERLGCASKTGCVSDAETSSFSRIVCAVGLQILSDLISRIWAFAVASDVSTDAFGHSHLDKRVRFPGVEVGDDVLLFHFLANRLFNEQHTV
jgi:hypothetical protein